MIIQSAFGENVFLLDTSPEEAQKYIASQNLDLKYAPKLGERALPVKQNEKGETVYQGRSYPNPNEYIEEEYLANQFHGQDGLGRYVFGYTDWNQGRVEGKNANGDVRGAYKYVDPNGKDFIANYWADSLGFHQEDNRPKVVLEPVTDTPDVQAAREEHFRKWKEAAEAAKANPDPYSDVYNQNANKYDEYRSQLEQANEIIGTHGQASEKQYERVDDPKKYEYKPREDEVTGPPRGFFYSFDYPVQLARNLKEREELELLRASHQPQ